MECEHNVWSRAGGCQMSRRLDAALNVTIYRLAMAVSWYAHVLMMGDVHVTRTRELEGHGKKGRQEIVGKEAWRLL